MKSLLVSLFILFSWLSFSQNFRGLDWGTSITELKSKYPDTVWEIEKDEDYIYYITEDYIGGLDTDIVYYFTKNKLVGGIYFFKETHVSNNLYYENFKTISNSLNEKYKMESEENWNNNTWKDFPHSIGYALQMGHVVFTERYEDDKTSILHEISSDDLGEINHFITYWDMNYVKELRMSDIDDF